MYQSKRPKPLRLTLRREPELHFYARIGDVDYVLALLPDEARRLGACLILIADLDSGQPALGEATVSSGKEIWVSLN